MEWTRSLMIPNSADYNNLSDLFTACLIKDNLPFKLRMVNRLGRQPFLLFRMFEFLEILTYFYHTGKCIRRFGGIYAYCRYFIDRKW